MTTVFVMFFAIIDSSVILKAKSATSMVYEFKNKRDCENAISQLKSEFSDGDGVCVEAKK